MIGNVVFLALLGLDYENNDVFAIIKNVLVLIALTYSTNHQVLLARSHVIISRNVSEKQAQFMSSQQRQRGLTSLLV